MSRKHPIREYMTPRPVTVPARATLEEALELMDDHGLRHLPVEKDGCLAGVISDRDIARAFSEPLQVGRHVVETAMTPEPYTALPDSDLREVLDIMAANRMGSVVIQDAGKRVVGIFTTTDAIRVLSDLL